MRIIRISPHLRRDKEIVLDCVEGNGYKNISFKSAMLECQHDPMNQLEVLSLLNGYAWIQETKILDIVSSVCRIQVP